MSIVTCDVSMSVDGFVAGANRRPEQPMGDGGEGLHTWCFAEDDATGREVAAQSVADAGIVICGRNTYDDSVKYWGANGPTGSLRLPVFVVTHTPPPNPPKDSVYTFVTSGIEDALARARAAAAGKNIAVAAGPIVLNQFLRAGLIDELSIHLVPVLFGDGTRLTEVLPAHVQLELVEHRAGKHAIHLRYRVARTAR